MLDFVSIVKRSNGLWHVMPPADSKIRLSCCPCGVSQRLEIKGLQLLRFGDHPLLLSVRIV